MRISLTGDGEMFGRGGRKLADMGPLYKQVGTLLLSQAGERLTRVLKMEEAGVRSGRLAASLTQGDPHNIYEQGQNSVRVGTNLAYAAQVQYGGTIYPREGRALAIPLVDRLKRDELWPRDLGPSRELLEYVPGKAGRAPVLIDPTGELGYGEGPLYALVASVTQEARPYLYIDDQTETVIGEDLWPAFLLGLG